MKRSILLFTAILALFTTSVAVAEEIRIATGYTFIKKVFDPLKSAFKEKSGIELRILYNDPVPALAALEKGDADMAGASMILEDWLQLAGKAGVPVKEGSAYGTFVPATEKTMIMVNAANSVKTLTKEQIKGLFTGKIQNWKEVGGNDAPVLVVWPSVSSGALAVFRAKIMDNEPVAKSVYDVPSIADTGEAVAATPEAIGIVTGSLNIKGVKEVAPALERPLTLVYKGKPSQNIQKLIDFLKSDGSRYIK